jgi:hypothetical protein
VFGDCAVRGNLVTGAQHPGPHFRGTACHPEPPMSSRGSRDRASRIASTTNSTARRLRFIASSANTTLDSSAAARPGWLRSSKRTVSVSSSRL